LSRKAAPLHGTPQSSPAAPTDSLFSNGSSFHKVESYDKSSTTTTVVEITEEESNYVASPNPFTCELPSQPKAKPSDVDFHWGHNPHKPTTHKHPTGAIPFPKDLQTLISWTDAFVERIHIVTETAEKVCILLVFEICLICTSE